VAKLASDVWHTAVFKDKEPLRWIALWPEPRITFNIPAEGEPRLVAENSMFDGEIVLFGTDRNARRAVCSSKAHAELVARLAQLGFRVEIETPDAASQCSEVLSQLNGRLAEAQGEFETIASSRVPDEKTRNEILQTADSLVLARQAAFAPKGPRVLGRKRINRCPSGTNPRMTGARASTKRSRRCRHQLDRRPAERKRFLLRDRKEKRQVSENSVEKASESGFRTETSDYHTLGANRNLIPK
jgi:hypothetical protein